MHLSIISYELKIIAYSVIFGCIFGLLYDIIKLVRMLLTVRETGAFKTVIKDFFLLNILDIVYSILFSVSFSVFLYYFNCGIFRWYFAVAAFLGFWLYRHSVGIVFGIVSKFTVNIIHKIIHIFIVIPVLSALHLLRRITDPIVRYWAVRIGVIRTKRIKRKLIGSIRAVVWEGEDNCEQKENKCVC